MTFLFSGAELSPETHSLVFNSFKNPPSSSFSTTWKVRDIMSLLVIKRNICNSTWKFYTINCVIGSGVSAYSNPQTDTIRHIKEIVSLISFYSHTRFNVHEVVFVIHKVCLHPPSSLHAASLFDMQVPQFPNI